MMPRRKSLMLFTVFFAMAALFVTTEAMAAGDCSAAQDLSCWTWDIGYRMEYNRTYTDSHGHTCVEADMTKQKKANINHVHLAVGKDVALAPIASSDTNATEIHPPGEGAEADNVLVGDRNNQVVTYTPNFPTGLFALKLCFDEPYEMGTVSAIVTGAKVEEFGATIGPIAPEPPDPPATALVGTSVGRTDEEGSITCYTGAGGLDLGCFDELGNPVTPYDGDAVDIDCTMSVNGTTESSSVPLHIDWTSDETQLSGHGSPSAVWYYKRGRWYCKEVPVGSGGCP
jgi:hypothetical protein